jgi:hypothetical protein
MISITISADQLRGAPAEVRRWIEAEVVSALALRPPAEAAEQNGQQLAVCSAAEVDAIFSMIRRIVPAVNVFFELGHQGVSAGEGLEAYRLADLLPQARLQRVDQLVNLLDVINGALQRIRGTANVSLYGLDGHGHCFVAAQTRQNISDLWRRLIDDSHVVAEEPTAASQAPKDGQPSAPAVPGAGQLAAE